MMTSSLTPTPQFARQSSRTAVASWSGGIDSTAVLALLLARGWKVHAFTLHIYGGDFGAREAEARSALRPHLEALPGKLICHEAPADFLWAFSPDGVEIPRRNKHILDHLIEKHAKPRQIRNIAMGEYIGADTWLVRDHVASADADARALAGYLYHEHGLDWRLLTLADFGESRYKSQRVALGWEVLGEAMYLTSNCLLDGRQHCGHCYKCIERHAAFMIHAGHDSTVYAERPEQHEAYSDYRGQMLGYDLKRSFASVQGSGSMPHAEEAQHV